MRELVLVTTPSGSTVYAFSHRTYLARLSVGQTYAKLFRAFCEHGAFSREELADWGVAAAASVARDVQFFRQVQVKLGLDARRDSRRRHYGGVASLPGGRYRATIRMRELRPGPHRPGDTLEANLLERLGDLDAC